jgi:hypothetical protein
MMFRHGLRGSGAGGLKLDQVDIESRLLHVARLKGGRSSRGRNPRPPFGVPRLQNRREWKSAGRCNIFYISWLVG